MSETLIKNDDAIENHKEVEERVEEIETANPIELVEDNATGDNHQVTLAVDPLKPEEDVQDEPASEMTAAEKTAEKEFEEVLEHLEEEALPELEFTIKSENLSDAETGGGTYTGGYDPEVETGESKLVEQLIEVATPETSEFVTTEIVNAEDVLNVEVQEHNKDIEVLVETDDDKTEDITTKVENITGLGVNGVDEDASLVSASVIEAAVEDEYAELTSTIEKLHDEIGLGDSDQELLETSSTEGDDENVPEYDDVSENAQVGDFTVTELQTITPDGVTSKEVDIDILSVDENSLDDCETGQVIHTGTSDTVDLPSDLQAEIKAITEAGIEEIDLYDAEIAEREEVTEVQADNHEICDDFESTEKEIYDEDLDEITGPEEVIEGDFTEVVMSTVVEANPDIDLVAIDDFEAKMESTDNPDAVEAEYRYVTDETPEITKEEGPILGDLLTEHVEQLDQFIHNEGAEIITASVDED